MNRYNSYKISDIEWIENIPEHWETQRLKYVSDINVSSVDKHIFEDEIQILLCNYTDVYYNEKISSRVNLKNGSCTIEEFKKFRIKKGDVLITKDSETPDDMGVPSYVEEDFDNVVCGYHLCIMSSDNNKMEGKYLFRQLQTKRIRNYFEINSFGITRFGLGKSSIENLPIILPPKNEQHQIVHFLDEKTEIIDELISIKERKIELLKEQRTSIINHSITKGLDPRVKMKDSGVEWIGEIPEHWDRVNLRYVLDLLTDFESNGSFSSVKENVKVDDEGQVWYVRMTDLENNNIRDENCKYCEIETYNFLHKTKLYGGELLITKRGEIGKVYLFPHNCGLSTLGPNSYLLRIEDDKVISKYLYYFYKSDGGQITLKLLDNSTTIGSLYKDDIKGSFVIVPPISEQIQIVDYLDVHTKEIDDMVSMEQKKIDLLKEYRQSLISEVITGKIDIRNNQN
jgi:type I restriction enzyme S subunit